MFPSKSLTTIVLIITIFSTIVLATSEKEVFFENWENGIGSWYVSNGIWDVGIPQSGPDSSYSPEKCAGTVLAGYYPAYGDSRLVSPQINLPSITDEEILQLRFWHWFKTEDGDDRGYVQISTDNGVNWETISSPKYEGNSVIWSYPKIDISQYADSTVRIAFYFLSDYNYNSYPGWYIDDILISINCDTFYNPENFDFNLRDWSCDNGLWEVGKPSAGPDSSYSDSSCAGTVLDGNYSAYSNTRLVSPYVQLDDSLYDNPELFYWHWFNTEEGDDKCQVQVRVFGGEWMNITGFGGPYSGNSGDWTQGYLPLNDFIDSTIQIGFYFTSDYNYNSYAGWYIDSISIKGGPNFLANTVNNTIYDFRLDQNYPNPFNPTTIIGYFLLNPSYVTLKVFNMQGKEIVTLVEKEQSTGYKSITWNGLNRNGNKVSSGIYFYSINLDNKRFISRKMILIR